MRLDDLEPLRAAVRDGRRMNACNQYGETLVHAACRAGSPRTLSFLLARSPASSFVRSSPELLG